MCRTTIRHLVYGCQDLASRIPEQSAEYGNRLHCPLTFSSAANDDVRYDEYCIGTNTDEQVLIISYPFLDPVLIGFPVLSIHQYFPEMKGV
jgi:hypothetical protein